MSFAGPITGSIYCKTAMFITDIEKKGEIFSQTVIYKKPSIYLINKGVETFPFSNEAKSHTLENLFQLQKAISI